MNLPVFIMTIGIPGSGKSRWAAKFLQSQYLFINPDNIRRELSGNVSDQTLNTQVWTIAKERTIDALKSGRSVIVDATNVSTLYRRQFLTDLPECNKFAKIFNVTPEIAYARIKADLDAGKDRANVPEELVYRMYGEFLYTKKVLLGEGFKIIKNMNF